MRRNSNAVRNCDVVACGQGEILGLVVKIAIGGGQSQVANGIPSGELPIEIVSVTVALVVIGGDSQRYS